MIPESHLTSCLFQWREADMDRMLELVGEELWTTTKLDCSVGYKPDSVSKCPRLFHILGCNHDHSIFLVALDGLPDDSLGGKIHALCRLVKQHDTSVAHQGDRHIE